MKLPDDIYDELGLQDPATMEVDYEFVSDRAGKHASVYFELLPTADDVGELRDFQALLISRMPFRPDARQTSRLHSTVFYLGDPTGLYEAVWQLNPKLTNAEFMAAMQELVSYCRSKQSVTMDAKVEGLVPLAGWRAVGLELSESRSLASFREKSRGLVIDALGACGVQDVPHFVKNYRPMQHLYDSVPHVTLLKTDEPVGSMGRFEGLEIPKKVVFSGTSLHGVATPKS